MREIKDILVHLDKSRTLATDYREEEDGIAQRDKQQTDNLQQLSFKESQIRLSTVKLIH